MNRMKCNLYVFAFASVFFSRVSRISRFLSYLRVQELRSGVNKTAPIQLYYPVHPLHPVQKFFVF